MRVMRAVSFCTTLECSFWNKPIFELVERDNPFCNQCRNPSVIVPETADYDGGPSYRQVRVEYEYWMPEARYRAVAIVTDERSTAVGVHTFRSPLLRTEKRALQVAESRLANLYLNQTPGDCPTYINFDLPLDAVQLQLRALLPGFKALATGDEQHQNHGQHSDTIDSECHIPRVG